MDEETFSDVDSVMQLSKDAETFGFDLQAGKTWIYPTNYSVRDYQFNITQAALYNNTLVSLPTGLGKTFIAAVVMYNFYRWYPLDKIIFMAPTRPLVKQQMEACYNIMAIPPNATAEITGMKQASSRANIWKEKRVFFITPHILQNDIDTILDLAPQIRCIVIDEAHKALGKNANCEAIRKIQKFNRFFRILALSATPGSNFNNIRDVIINLFISHIEMRTNESIDVMPFVFQRTIETIVIPITGKLLSLKNQYIKILDTYTRPLVNHNVIYGNCVNISKGRFVYIMKEFKERKRQHPQYNLILRNLNICITLYHGYELLLRHGMRGFLLFFESNITKPLINPISELHNIIDDLRNYLGPIEDIELLPDGSLPEIKGEMPSSHPKFNKLISVLLEHFNKVKNDTRVMVFCEYRESVMEIYAMLLRHQSVVKPRIFIGQNSVTQARQIQTVKMFKSGDCNTLISTCIGEEGLDVGEVDLIVCFDISSKSPIRMVQRMGRTGRKREGHVIVLVTEGKEQQLLNDCLRQKDSMNVLLESPQIKNYLYANNPRMVPNSIQPECQKMYMTIEEANQIEKSEKTKKNKTKRNNIKAIFEDLTNSKDINTTKNREKNITDKTQNKDKKTTLKRNNSTKLDTKQCDIRSMFLKITNSQLNTQPKEEPILTNPELELDPKLNTLLIKVKKYLSKINQYEGENKIFTKCKSFICKRNSPNTSKCIIIPNVSILDEITTQTIESYNQILNKLDINLKQCLDYFLLDSFYDCLEMEYDKKEQEEKEKSINVTQIERNESELCSSTRNEELMNNDFNFDIWDEKTFLFESSNYSEMDKNKSNDLNFDPNKTIISTTEIVKENDCNRSINTSLSITQIIDILNQSKQYNNNNNNNQDRNEINESINKSIENVEQIDTDKKSQSEIIIEQTNRQNCKENTIINDSEISINSLIINDSDAEINMLYLNGIKFQQNLKNIEKKTEKMATVAAAAAAEDEEKKNKEINERIKLNVANFFHDCLHNSENVSSITGSNEISNVSQLDKSNLSHSENIEEIVISDDSISEVSLLNFTQRRRKLKLQSLKQNKKLCLDNTVKENIIISDNSDNENYTQSNNKRQKCLQLKPKPSEIKSGQSNLNNRIVDSDSDSDSDFIKKSKRIKTISNTNSNKRNKFSKRVQDNCSKQKPVCDFIEYEAAVENNKNYVSDSGDEQNDVNDYIQCSFINDTQTIHDRTDMQTKYLQSIKSPKFKFGALKIPKLKPLNENIFSQMHNVDEIGTYIEDSFCVNTTNIQTEMDNITDLEIAEAKLKRRQYARNNKKRKRILQFSSDSD